MPHCRTWQFKKKNHWNKQLTYYAFSVSDTKIMDSFITAMAQNHIFQLNWISRELLSKSKNAKSNSTADECPNEGKQFRQFSWSKSNKMQTRDRNVLQCQFLLGVMFEMHPLSKCYILTTCSLFTVMQFNIVEMDSELENS